MIRAGTADTTIKVAPLVGAWIEILVGKTAQRATTVAPLVGAWIEILEAAVRCCIVTVAPLVGAWIEITAIPTTDHAATSRSSCRSVD